MAKIAIDITQAQYQGTGVGTYTYQLAKHLLKLNTKHQFILFGGSLRGYGKLKSIAQEIGADSKLYPLPPTFQHQLFNNFHKLPIELFTGQVELFHASDWTHPPTIKAKTITTIHDLTTLKFPQSHHPKTLNTHKARLAHALKESAHFIADSDATKQDMVELLGVEAKQITAIHLAPRQSILDFASQNQKTKQDDIKRIKAKYGLDNYILSLGTREPRKNLPRTIEAFQYLSTDYQLVIAGRYGWGDDQKSVKNVSILGFVPEPDLPALIAGASSFVFPSLYEGFGLPVLEAMTLGVPVVTSKRGSLKEVAGSAAIIVDPTSTKSIASGMEKSLKASNTLTQKALKHAGQFTWQKTAENTLKVYENVLGS